MGVAAGATGVLLPEQMAEYGVDKATVGLTFVAFSVGYFATATANGVLLHRLGVRGHLALGTVAALAAALTLTVPAGFALLLAGQVVLGLGLGALDAGLNSYLSTLDRSTALLNFHHAFFGVGALIGPLAAAALIDRGASWHVFFGLFAVAMAAQLGALAVYPRSRRDAEEAEQRPRLGAALRLRVVLVLAAFLGVYVGVEVSVGNWAFSYLTEDRRQALLAAGWAVSGYWAGLTLGRLTLNAAAERVGLSVARLTALCIGGAGVASLAVWLLPSTVAATACLVVLGFFLGPLFPTTIAVVPRLVRADLVHTAIGMLVATSVVGGATLPLLAGVSAEHLGLWSLLPLAAAGAAGMGVLWWRIARRLRPVA
jgi:fucose permease